MSIPAVKIFSILSKSVRRPMSMCTRAISIYKTNGTNKLLLKQTSKLSSKSDNQLRTYATYREYENRQIWQCPIKRRRCWNYRDCDHYMTPKDWDMFETRAQTEGSCRERMPFRDPPNPCCQQMTMPHCPYLKRVDWCDKAVIQPHCIKRDAPYKAFSECKEADRVKRIHQCDYCPETSIYLPYVRKRPGHSDCTQTKKDHEQRYKWTNYSSHCYRKRKYLTCFWPYLTH